MNDVRDYGAIADGVTDCITAINAALIVDDIIIRNGTFIISDNIRIPSDRTVYIDCAEIKVKDYAYKSIFVNADFQDGNENIKITGLGCAVLNSNAEYNLDMDYEINELYTPTAFNHNQIIFCNVDSFEITGLTSADRTKYWLQLQKCTNGLVNDNWMDYPIRYDNQDGIATRFLCEYITISNLRGRSGDDFCSINCGTNSGISVQIDEYRTGGAHDITFEDINTGYSFYRALIILNGDGSKIYNVTVNRWLDNQSRKFCWLGPPGYTDIPPETDDTYDIIMDDIEVNGLGTNIPVFDFTDSMKDMVVTNCVNNTDEEMYTDTGGIQENVSINGEIIFT